MQAKCFLADNFLAPEIVYHKAKGHYLAGFRGNEGVWRTNYQYKGGKKVGVENNTFDTISAAVGALNSQRIYLGRANDGASRINYNTLYLVGSRDDVLKMLLDASVLPEIILYPKVYVGVFHWPHTFGPDRIAIRIHVNESRPMAEINGFRDFEVTRDVGCGGGPAWTTVHPAAFHAPLKHFLDKNKIQ